MARAEFDSVGKRYAATAALEQFTLSVADGELIAVLGPSGCGKSTLLRVTAGLEPLSQGSIRLDDTRIDDLPPGARDVAMVFQSYALYPHMTVRGNIEFPLRMRGVAAAPRARQVEEVAALLELGSLLDRRPAHLSGGQRQRVALARALIRRPALFLLDEPLSNLDARLRLSVRQYTRDLQRRLGVTTLYVTHDQTEAMTLGDRVVVMHQGRIQQVDAPLAVYAAPANVFVAGFVGTPPMNLLPAEYVDGVLQIGNQRIRPTVAQRAVLERSARTLMLGLRPEAFAAADQNGGVVAETDAHTCEALGSETIVRASLGPHIVVVRLFGIVHDLPARVTAPVEALHVFDRESGRRLGG